MPDSYDSLEFGFKNDVSLEENTILYGRHR